MSPSPSSPPSSWGDDEKERKSQLGFIFFLPPSFIVRMNNLAPSLPGVRIKGGGRWDMQRRNANHRRLRQTRG